MNTNSKVFAIGNPGVGKTVVLADLIYKHRHELATGMLISAADDQNDSLVKVFPDIYRHEKMDTLLLRDFVNRQKLVGKTNCPYKRAALAVDDSGYDKNFVNSKPMQYIMKVGRHADMFFLFAMHGAKGADRNIRPFIDYVFMGKEKSTASRKLLWEEYAGVIPTFDLFNDIMDVATEDHKFLVIDNKVDSNKMEDSVFWYKADYHPDGFSFGCQEYWDWANLRYTSDYAPVLDL